MEMDKEKHAEQVGDLERMPTLAPTHTAGEGFDELQYQRSQLSAEHREYLIRKHGSLDHLDPIPDMSDADPYNFSTGRKVVNLALVATLSMTATFSAAAIQSAFVNIVIDLDVTIQRASYLVSLFIAILGGAPLFWRPIANRYGRRPVFMLSLICSLVANIGCAKSPSYATMGLCRAIVAFFISPASAIGTAVVAEVFFKRNRASAIGVWTLLVTIGVPVAPLVFGPVAQYLNYRWIYYILAIINGVQFILYAFLGLETRYIRGTQPSATPALTTRPGLFTVRRIDPAPMAFKDFVHPLTMAAKPSVMLPAAAYAMVFLFGSILTSIEIPSIYPLAFGLTDVQTGLQFIAFIIGSLIGEQIGGYLSDWWMRRPANRPANEYRLWLGYIGLALTIMGVWVFLMQTGAAVERKKWDITPLIGVGLASCGNQIVTTVFITYAVDCYRAEAGSVGVFITFVRQTWGFIGPFWFPQMIESLGYAASAAVMTALLVGVSVIPTMLLQWKGQQWRQ